MTMARHVLPSRKLYFVSLRGVFSKEVAIWRVNLVAAAKPGGYVSYMDRDDTMTRIATACGTLETSP